MTRLFLTGLLLLAPLHLCACSQGKGQHSCASVNNNMDDKELIYDLYCRMCQAMINKDTATLNEIHAPEFVLTHMTGMRQNKQVYINAIASGVLNYYSATHDSVDVNVAGNRATMVGRNRVEAAVFGGGRHTWRLQLTFHLEKRGGRWLLLDSKASTY